MNFLNFLILTNALTFGLIASMATNDRYRIIINDHLTKDFYSLFKIRPEAKVDLKELEKEYYSLATFFYSGESISIEDLMTVGKISDAFSTLSDNDLSSIYYNYRTSESFKSMTWEEYKQSDSFKDQLNRMAEVKTTLKEISSEDKACDLLLQFYNQGKEELYNFFYNLPTNAKWAIMHPVRSCRKASRFAVLILYIIISLFCGLLSLLMMPFAVIIRLFLLIIGVV